MKVVYEEPIWKKINNEIFNSKINNKKIDYILLTRKEKKELVDFCFSSLDCAYNINQFGTKEEIMKLNEFHYYGTKLRFED